MKKQQAQLTEKKLAGITCRTSNAIISASDPANNPIALTVQQYLTRNIPEALAERIAPGTTYGVYTHYESDVNGEYTYFIGEEVASFSAVPEGVETLVIPAQTYAKFTNHPGPMPAVCIDMWTKIWKQTSTALGGERAYIADFEVYDERSRAQDNAVLDIYIGITRAP